MLSVEHKHVLVLGLSPFGLAAVQLLCKRGARVVALDEGDSPALRQQAAELRALGATVQLAGAALPDQPFEFAVVTPELLPDHPLCQAARRRQLPVIGELELGYQQSLCLHLAISGTNGKSTTAELIARILGAHQLKTLVSGRGAQPLCSVVEQSRNLDFLTVEAPAAQLEATRFFRPTVGVLLNLTAAGGDRYPTHRDQVRAAARLFQNQQAFDWAIVQSEALAQLRSLGVEPPSKIITFSASNRRADLCLDRGLILSRLDYWSGPLFDMDQGPLRGPHNAENLMAALAVGRVLRVPLDVMVEVLRQGVPTPHRCERLGEVHGVEFINDAKASNLDALHKALLSLPPKPGGEPHVWLLAGGRDDGQEFHDVGPLLSQRAKGAFLFGPARERMRAAWSLFTPCTLVGSLLEGVQDAARNATPGDVVLFSPACASSEPFQDYEERGHAFRQTVRNWEPSAPPTLAAPVGRRLGMVEPAA